MNPRTKNTNLFFLYHYIFGERAQRKKLPFTNETKTQAASRIASQEKKKEEFKHILEDKYLARNFYLMK